MSKVIYAQLTFEDMARFLNGYGKVVSEAIINTPEAVEEMLKLTESLLKAGDEHPNISPARMALACIMIAGSLMQAECNINRVGQFTKGGEC